VAGDDWNRYHAGLYHYPSGYPGDVAAVQSQLFAVNIGHLSAWWWNVTALVETEQFPYPIYWPSLVCDYRNEWPDAAPQIVIASFQGSAYGGYFDDGTKSLRFFGNKAVTIRGTDVVTNEWGNPHLDEFTFETWVKPASITGYRGVMDMVSSTNAFSLFIKGQFDRRRDREFQSPFRAPRPPTSISAP
jgi:hypothetical protein